MEFTWSVFFFAVALQGLFLSVVVIARKEPYPKSKFLGALILLFSISLLDNIMFWSDFYMRHPHWLGVSLSFPFFYGVVFYYYVKSVNRCGSSSNKLYTHFIAGIGILMWYLPYYLSASDEKLILINTWNNSVWNALVIPFGGVLFLWLYLGKTRRFLRRIESKEGIVILTWKNWLGKIYFFFVVFVFLRTVSLGMNLGGISTQISDFMLAFGQSGLIYLIGYLGLSNSKLLNGISANTSKYQTNSLSSAVSCQIYQDLLNYIETSYCYRNCDLKLPELAGRLKVTTHQLSQAINENSGHNFAGLINKYRVEEALTLMRDNKNFSEIAFQVGFNNRTSFNEAFKKLTGKTPTAYRNSFSG